MNRRSLAVMIAALLAITSMFTSVGTASADPDDPPEDLKGSPGRLSQLSTSGIGTTLVGASGQVTALVELDTPSGLDVVADGGGATDVLEAAEDTQTAAAEVVPQVSARSSSGSVHTLGTLTSLVSGVLVSGDAEQVRALVEEDKVLGVYRVGLKSIENSSAVEFTESLNVWQDAGVIGEGVRVGVIDTGIDYTHATFGGPGTTEAYQQAYGDDGTGEIPEGLFDPSIFAGGWDFAGPTYDANPNSALPGVSPIPAPDANPIDSPYTSSNSGHGTHVAGTAVGRGVTADGTTFDGDYSDLNDLSDWQVGPGTAPGAEVYALKVFGDLGGSTGLTALALDWAADPNGDGDFSDRLDVVNLSLGASGAPADDPENILVEALTALGTVVVASAGNSGDLVDIGGSPGSAVSSLTVANSVGAPLRFDGLEVIDAGDPDLVGLWAGQNSIDYAGETDVEAEVVHLGARFDGCSAFTEEQSAAAAGKIVYLWWDNTAARACGSGARFDFAEAAGAAGVILDTTEPVFSAGIAGNAGIPGIQLTAAASRVLVPAFESGGVVARIGQGLAGSAADDSAADLINPSSSRGTHGSLSSAKPDVAAPGTRILSAASGTGAGGHALTGTSMSAPVVAGIAALVREAEPGYSAPEVKAAVVNTATHDVYTDVSAELAYGPARVGAGRVDARDAVSSRVLAYDSESPNSVTSTFGVVDVGAETVTVRRSVTVRNLGSTQVRYNTSVQTATTVGGATITATPATVTVPAGQSRNVTLTLTADPETLSRDLDPTSEASQIGVPREYLAELTGRLVLTSGNSELRVPVRAAVRPVADITAADTIAVPAGSDAGQLSLSGRGLAGGGWFSLATPLILADTSPKLEDIPGFVTSQSAIASADLRYVGWTSTAPAEAAAGGNASDGYLGIGVAVDGDWASLGRAATIVADLDIDGDGSIDLQSQVLKYPDTDVTLAATFDNRTGSVLALEPVNLFFGSVDAGVFDSSVTVLPIPLELIPEGATPTVSVWTYSPYAYDASGEVDSVDAFQVDPYAPPVWFETDIAGAFSTLAADGGSIGVNLAPDAASAEVLVLHHHNGSPVQRSQVVDVTREQGSASSTVLRLAEQRVSVGTPVEATVTVTGESVQPSGEVTLLSDGEAVATGQLEGASGLTSTAGVTVPGNLSAGRHQLVAAYAGGGSVEGSVSEPVTLQVVRAAPVIDLTAASWEVGFGSRPTVTVGVRGADGAPQPSGTVLVFDGILPVAHFDAASGQRDVRLPAKVITTSVRVVYVGDANYTPGTTAQTLRVRPGTLPWAFADHPR